MIILLDQIPVLTLICWGSWVNDLTSVVAPSLFMNRDNWYEDAWVDVAHSPEKHFYSPFNHVPFLLLHVCINSNFLQILGLFDYGFMRVCLTYDHRQGDLLTVTGYTNTQFWMLSSPPDRCPHLRELISHPQHGSSCQHCTATSTSLSCPPVHCHRLIHRTYVVPMLWKDNIGTHGRKALKVGKTALSQARRTPRNIVGPANPPLKSKKPSNGKRERTKYWAGGRQWKSGKCPE